MRYDRYTWIFPPRAELAIPTSMLRFYENLGYLAQVKKNGTNSVIFVPPIGEGEIFAKTRDGTDHKQWSFTPKSLESFERTRGNGWNVFNAELMHWKIPGIKDTNYVHDVLVHDGEYLLGSRYQHRYTLLGMIFKGRPIEETHSHFVMDDHTWIAKNHHDSFRDLFDTLKEEDEGLVLKNPTGQLEFKDNGGWTVKCRRRQKNFGF